MPRPQHLPPPSLECTASPRAEACPTLVGPERGEVGWASPNVPGHIVPRASAGPPSPFVGAGKGISHLLCLKARNAPHSCVCSGCPGSRTHALDRPWCVGAEAEGGHGAEAQRGGWDPPPAPPSISDTGWVLQCRGVGQPSRPPPEMVVTGTTIESPAEGHVSYTACFGDSRENANSHLRVLRDPVSQGVLTVPGQRLTLSQVYRDKGS